MTRLPLSTAGTLPITGAWMSVPLVGYGVGQLLSDRGTGGAHLHQGLPRRGHENAGRPEVDVVHGLRAGHHADRDVGVANSIGWRLRGRPHVQCLGLALVAVPDGNREATGLQPARDRTAHLSCPQHRYPGHSWPSSGCRCVSTIHNHLSTPREIWMKMSLVSSSPA